MLLLFTYQVEENENNVGQIDLARIYGSSAS